MSEIISVGSPFGEPGMTEED